MAHLGPFAASATLFGGTLSLRGQREPFTPAPEPVTVQATNGWGETYSFPVKFDLTSVPRIDCVVSSKWSACSAPCGGGTQTAAIVTPVSGGGAACPATTRACNDVPCRGYWEEGIEYASNDLTTMTAATAKSCANACGRKGMDVCAGAVFDAGKGICWLKTALPAGKGVYSLGRGTWHNTSSSF
jgi:hypothetical protein